MPENLTGKIKGMVFTQKSIPIVLLITSFFAFGLLIPWLGYYWDDWERILVLKLYGSSAFIDYFSTKRPFAAWVYLLFGPIIGGSSVGWHLLSLFARWLASVSFWWVLRLVWPAYKKQAFFTSLLFLVYPLFLQQSVMVYFKHWLAYSFYFISLGLTAASIRKPSKNLWLTSAAVLAEFLHLSLLEYFLGLEILRPLLMFLIIYNQSENKRNSLKKVIWNWSPYLLVLIAYTIWRLAFGANLEDDPYSPQLFLGLINEPLTTLKDLINIGLQDFIHIFLSSWHKTIVPAVINIHIPFTLLSWGIAAILSIGLFFYMTKLKFEPSPSDEQEHVTIQPFLIGLLAAALGALPIWITFRPVSMDGLFTDRFALATMAGASLAWVAAIDWFITNPKRKILFINLLIFVGVSFQLRTANDFRWSWTLQQRTYWQLFWRAPNIKPNTVILTNTALFPYVFPQFAFNTLYREPENYGDGGYIFSYVNEFVKDQTNWLEGKDLEINYLFFNFKANTKNSLIIFKEERTSNCLWILDSNDQENPYLTDQIRQALAISNLSRIDPASKDGLGPYNDVFGNEPEHGWCYYYQKIELANQLKDYENASHLADEAISNGFTPSDSSANSPQEWISVIESYAYLGRWEEAAEVTKTSFSVDNNYKPMLCNLWHDIEKDTPQGGEKVVVITDVFDHLECQPKTPGI